MRVNTSKILLLDEIQAVLVDLQDRSEDSINAWTNLIIFRLSCCCGLRASEICGLTMDDLILEGARPIIQIRKENTSSTKESTIVAKCPCGGMQELWRT
jgi:integrase